MKLNVSRSRLAFQAYRGYLAVLLAVLLIPGEALALAPQDQTPAAVFSQIAATAPSQTPAAHGQTADVKIPPDQLDSLVAPIALYPDPLLGQVLVASTYPLEIVQLQQWLAKNPNLKDKALADAVAKQPWDPSIQSMAALPDVVKRLSDDIQWTTNLGNAFLAQQGDVMDAVQRMRKKAEGNGALKSNEQMTVENQVVDNKQVIVVQPAQPDVVYVPSYNPTVVYGAAVYPYPPIYYPPPIYSTGAVVAATAITFGVGLAIGAAWGGGWGYGCGWGGNDVNINVNNNFQQNNIRNNSGNRGSGNTWQHNPQHRGGTPYANQGVSNRFGGGNRGGVGGVGGVGGAGRPGGVGGPGGAGGIGGPGGAGSIGGPGGAGGAGRPGGVGGAGGPGGVGGPGGAGNIGGPGGAGGAGRPGGVGGPGGAGGAGSPDRVGNRNPQPRSSGGSSFGGGSGGLSGGSARSSSSRGNSSMGRSGGGRSGGGGRRR